MADATKHNNGGSLILDLKSLFSILKTRRTVAFAYGFMFAFVAFTVFLAFNPSSNSSSPWFTNIFSTSTSRSSGSSSSSTSNSYGSQISSIFSYFFPNSSSQQSYHTFSPPSTDSSTDNNTTSFQSVVLQKEPPDVEAHTGNTPSIDQAKVSKGNQTTKSAPVSLKAANHTQGSPVSSPSNTLSSSPADNSTQNAENSDKSTVSKANRTVTASPKVSEGSNHSNSSPIKSVSTGNSDSATGKKNVEEKSVTSNYTASLLKKQSNGNNSGVSVKQEKDKLVESLMNCDFFYGEWIRDDSYPLYKPGSCSLIDEQFNCILNGRPDKDYQRLKWKPKGCSLPRLDGGLMLDLLRGKRLVFVGDSLNRNMWESLICILRNSVKDQSKVFEAQGRHHFRGEASYSFIFKDYGCSVEFFVSPFLVQEWEVSDKNGSKKETLRLDLVGKSSDQYKSADIIVFNTGHWWTHEKTSKGRDYYQEGSHVYGELNVLEAFRKALTTWARWVDANVNPLKSLVFFRGYSASHFSGGQWNSGGQCDSETQPIKNETFLKPYSSKMMVLEKVMKGMKTHVTYLNITRMTDFRKDGHPSIYRKLSLSDEERRSPLRFQDCSHWCLPGVPDAWNELLYAELLVKQHQKQQQQEQTP